MVKFASAINSHKNIALHGAGVGKYYRWRTGDPSTNNESLDSSGRYAASSSVITNTSNVVLRVCAGRARAMKFEILSGDFCFDSNGSIVKSTTLVLNKLPTL